MVSASDILNGKVLIVDGQEANILMLDRTLRGAIDIKGKGRKPQQYTQGGCSRSCVRYRTERFAANRITFKKISLPTHKNTVMNITLSYPAGRFPNHLLHPAGFDRLVRLTSI